MKIILDTSCLSLIENANDEKSEKLMENLRAHNSYDIHTTIISFEEQMRGWIITKMKEKSDDIQFELYKKLSIYVENFKEYSILEFDTNAQTEYSRLKLELASIKNKPDPMSLRIAAIALSQKAILVSQLTVFKIIPNLIVVDWTE